MADLPTTNKNGSVLDAASGRFASQFAGDIDAGEELTWAGTCVEVQAGGRLGRVYKCNAGAFAGVVHERKKVGQPATVHGIGAIFHASDAGTLVPGALYYVSATPGRIADAATAKDSQGAFLAISTTELQVIRVGKLA